MIHKYNNILIFLFGIVIVQNVLGHDDHKKRNKIPSIGKIYGIVVDSTNQKPIEYASISLIDPESKEIITGDLSNRDGVFMIEEIQLGYYDVSIEFVGYAPKLIESISLNPRVGGSIKQDLGTISLAISALNLTEIEVIGDESQFIQTIDKQIFNVGKNLASSGGTGTDVLRKVPTVDVDIDGKVTIAGDANVTILIDGKKSGLTGTQRRGEVDNIAASMIERVEVITNPSAKYDPEGVGGIINIVLKRGTFEGFNGSVSCLAGQYNKMNLNGNVNYKTDQWNLFTSTNFSTGDRIGNGLREYQYIYSDRTDSLFQNTERIRTPRNFSIRLGGDLYPTTTSSMGYTFTVSDHKDLSEDGIDYILNTIDPDKIGEVHFTEHDDGFHMDHSFYYNNDFDKKERKLKAEVDFSWEEDDVHQHSGTESQHDLSEISEETEAVEANNSLEVSVDYEDKLNDRFSIETGGKADLRSYGTTLSYLLQPYKNQYDEDIFAAYFIGSYDLNHHFSIKAGARFEKVNTNAVLEKGSSANAVDSTNVLTAIFDDALAISPFENPYTSVYPSINLLYKLSEKQNLQFGYSKKVNRPRRRTLSPFPQNTTDFSRIRVGNPYLNPEYSDVMELKYWSSSRKVNFNMGLSYKLTKDAIMWWDRDYVEYDSTSYEVLTSDNSENSENFSGNMTVLYRPMQSMSIMLSGWAWNTRTYGNGESDLNGNSQGYYLRSQLTVNLPAIARVEFSMGGRGRMKITTGTIPASFRSSLGIQKSFMDNRLSVTLKVNDLFNTGKFKINTEYSVRNPRTDEEMTQLMYAERQRDRRFVSLVLNYNFGKQQRKKWDRNQFDRGGGGMEMDY